MKQFQLLLVLIAKKVVLYVYIGTRGQKGIIQLICIELYRYVVSSKEEVLNHKHLENWKSMRYLANYFLVTRLTEEVGDVIEQKVLNKMLQGGKKGLDHVASCKAKGSK